MDFDFTFTSNIFNNYYTNQLFVIKLLPVCVNNEVTDKTSIDYIYTYSDIDQEYYNNVIKWRLNDQSETLINISMLLSCSFKYEEK